MGPVTVLSSDAHVFEPPDLWTTRIDAGVPGPRALMVRVDGADEIVVEQGQVGHRAPVQHRCPLRGAGDDLRPSALRGRPRGGSDPDQHLRDMRLDGVAGEVLTLRRACSTSGLPTRRSCRRSFAPTTIISTFETLPSKDIETLPVPVELTGVLSGHEEP